MQNERDDEYRLRHPVFCQTPYCTFALRLGVCPGSVGNKHTLLQVSFVSGFCAPANVCAFTGRVCL